MNSPIIRLCVYCSITNQRALVYFYIVHLKPKYQNTYCRYVGLLSPNGRQNSFQREAAPALLYQSLYLPHRFNRVNILSTMTAFLLDLCDPQYNHRKKRLFHLLQATCIYAKWTHLIGYPQRTQLPPTHPAGLINFHTSPLITREKQSAEHVTAFPHKTRTVFDRSACKNVLVQMVSAQNEIEFM